MSCQLLNVQSAASSLSGSSGSTDSSPSGSSALQSEDGSAWNRCQRVPSARHGRRRKTRRQGEGGRRGGSTSAKKTVKNAREKERVRIVRLRYEELCRVLKGQVEKGSGHFSKVRALAAAIRRIEELTESVKRLSEERTTSSPDTQETDSDLTSLSPLGGDVDLTGVGAEISLSEISLNCEESLEPAEKINDSNPAIPSIPFHEEVTYPSLLSTTPYFSYSSGPGDFPPIVNNYCQLNINPAFPPSSTLLCSPELHPHPHPSLPTTACVLDTTPPPPYSHHCGQDVWLAIGCN